MSSHASGTFTWQKSLPGTIAGSEEKCQEGSVRGEFMRKMHSLITQ